MKKGLLIVGIVLSLSFVSCGNTENNMGEEVDTQVEDKASEVVEESSTDVDKKDTEMIIFNKETLAKYNGKDGMPGYVAVDGVVYDVTDVAAWQSPHAGQFEPGKDYSEEIRQSPHGLKNLKKLKVVGSYEE